MNAVTILTVLVIIAIVLLIVLIGMLAAFKKSPLSETLRDFCNYEKTGFQQNSPDNDYPAKSAKPAVQEKRNNPPALVKKRVEPKVSVSNVKNRIMSHNSKIVEEHSYLNSGDFEDKKEVLWFFNSCKSMKVMYHGSIKYGLNLEKMMIREEGLNTFSIELPDPELFSHVINNTQILSSEDGYFNKITEADRNKLMLEKKAEYEAGILDSLFKKACRKAVDSVRMTLDALPVAYKIRLKGVLRASANNRKFTYTYVPASELYRPEESGHPQPEYFRHGYYQSGYQQPEYQRPGYAGQTLYDQAEYDEDETCDESCDDEYMYPA